MSAVPSGDPPAAFRELLVRHEAFLRALLRNEARGLLRFETEDDLVQGVLQRALLAEDRFEYRGEAEFEGWLVTLARRQVADRHDYWQALKRGSSGVLRLSVSGSRTGSRHGLAPASPGPGPSTFASRRELLVISTKALAVLPERDRKLVCWMSEEVPLEEQAARLDMSYAAAQRAGLRALERFRKAFQLLSERA
ncbi:MAG TPA: sigma-70 family RNA polymerase sigma factor [Planctomycetota bacterium]